MSATKPRLVSFAKWSAVPVGLVLSAALVWQASYSAFSATTSNPTNNWSTGTVSLTDDDGGVAMFTATGLKPGSTGNKCILVTYGGSLAATVELYGTGKTATNALDTYITLTVEQGTGATYGGGCGSFVLDAGVTYTGTLAAFAATYTSFATGFGTWAPTGAAQTKSYKITYTLSAAAPNSTQNSNAQIGLTWEAQNS